VIVFFELTIVAAAMAAYEHRRAPRSKVLGRALAGCAAAVLALMFGPAAVLAAPPTGMWSNWLEHPARTATH